MNCACPMFLSGNAKAYGWLVICSMNPLLVLQTILPPTRSQDYASGQSHNRRWGTFIRGRQGQVRRWRGLCGGGSCGCDGKVKSDLARRSLLSVAYCLGNALMVNITWWFGDHTAPSRVKLQYYSYL